ncbi:MAG: N-acetylmuramoyl-L-alanine amidase [Chitinophagales bacterium]
MKHRRMLLIIACSFVLVLIAALPALASTGTVTGKVVNLRSGPGTNYAKKGNVSRGTIVQLVKKQAEWWKVTLKNGQGAWIKSSYIKVNPTKVSTTSPGTFDSNRPHIEITSPIVRLRTGPGTNYSIKGQCKIGEKYNILGQENGWYRVQIGNEVAYLAGWLAKMCQVAPAAAAEMPADTIIQTAETTQSMPIDPGTTIVVPESTVDNVQSLPTGQVKIVLDAGHGGQDPGTHGPADTKEKDINLALVLKTGMLLQQEGYQVIYTRQDDTFIALTGRTDYANAEKASLFISIHCNGSTSASKTGTSVYYYTSEADPVIAAQGEARAKLAECIQHSLLAALGTPDDGIRQNNFVVLCNSVMPSVLIESAYLTNAGEETLLNDSAFQDKEAAAIVAGVKEYLGGTSTETQTGN